MIKHVDWNVLWTFHALHVLLFFPQSIFSLMLCLVKIFSFHLNPTLTSLKEELKIQSISHLNDQKVILSLAPHQALGHVFINPDFWTRRQPDRFFPCFLTRAGKKTCVKKNTFGFDVVHVQLFCVKNDNFFYSCLIMPPTYDTVLKRI